MKPKLFSFLLALVASVGTIIAERVQIGDLYYNLNATNRTAEVTYQGQWPSSNYSGLTSADIPSSVTYNSQTYSVTSIGEYAFDECSSLTSVTIGNSVTSIGELAFYECSSLTSVTIPNSVTSIGGAAFYGCSSLPVEDNIRYADTYLVEAVDKSLSSYTIKEGTRFIGSYAFYECTSLTSVTIGNSVTSIGEYAFYKCSSLTSVTIGNSVTSIGMYAFWGCSSLTSVTIPNSVTSIGEEAFSGCSGLKSIIWNAKSCNDSGQFGDQVESFIFGDEVETIPVSCCANMQNLSSVTIPVNVTSIGNSAFGGCSGLKSVIWNAKNCNNSGQFGNQVESFIFGDEVETIPVSCCAGMQNLSTITIPNNVTNIGNSAFSGCSGLKSVIWNAKNCNVSGQFGDLIESFIFGDEVEVIPASCCAGMKDLVSITIPNNVINIGHNAFYGCSGLNSIMVMSGNNMFDSRDNCNAIIETSTNTLIAGCQNTVIPNSVTSIGANAFYKCTGLTSITIPNSVTSIGEGAFYNCSALTSVTIPNSVTSIGSSAFSGCSSLTSITIPSSVTSIGIGAFCECSGLKSVEWNAKKCEADSYSYSYSGLTSIISIFTTIIIEDNSCYTSSQIKSFKFGDDVENIPDYLCIGMTGISSVTIPKCVKSIGDCAFAYCSGLTSVSIGNSVTGIGSSAFKGCSALTSVTIGNSVTNIGSSAFSGCSSLNSIELPNNITAIGDSVFYGCSNLSDVIISNNLVSIPRCAFQKCSGLKSIIIGANVKVMESNALSGCSSLETITCYSMRPPTINKAVWDSGLYNLPYSIIVYVPSDYLSFYLMHDIWGLYDIRPLDAASVQTTNLQITPTANTATIVWPSVGNAASYELVIQDKNGNVVCTLIFNANGQLTSIAFAAPSRNIQQQTQTAGFSFTVTGLDSGTGYNLTITAKDNQGTVLQTTTQSFTTTGGVLNSVDETVSYQSSLQKLIKDGQVLILRDGKTFTVQGQQLQ